MHMRVLIHMCIYISIYLTMHKNARNTVYLSTFYYVPLWLKLIFSTDLTE